MASNEEIIRNLYAVAEVDIFHLEGGKVSAFDCQYAGTIMLRQLGVLGNLEAAVWK